MRFGKSRRRAWFCVAALAMASPCLAQSPTDRATRLWLAAEQARLPLVESDGPGLAACHTSLGRLDAWYTARASRRLEQLRSAAPTGVYVGGFAWVENLKADDRPDSEGHLLAPSLGQAASAAILRSGFIANQQAGAFNINLDSRRTQGAQALLQGLTRDQPLAALYGYRIERGLRDALPTLGKFIWPLRLSYPWRAAGDNTSAEPQEAIGARDVVDGVALLAAWDDGPAAVRARLLATMLARPGPAPAPARPKTNGRRSGKWGPMCKPWPTA